MHPIEVDAAMAAELSAAVEASTGRPPLIHGFRGRRSPPGITSLAYIGGFPDMVAFELVAIMAGRIAHLSCAGGYAYGASDFVEEMRRALLRLRVPHTEAVGRDLVYYWPTLALIESDHDAIAAAFIAARIS